MAAAKTPELPELTRENFERLTREAIRAFLFRAAVRMMPLLGGNEGGLRCWPMDDRRRHLAAVVAAIDVVILVSGNKITAAVIAVRARAAVAAAGTAYDVADNGGAYDGDAAAFSTAFVNQAARAAVADARSADARVVDAAVRTANTAAIFAARAYTTKASMQWGLQQLMQWDEHKQTTKVAESTPVPTELLFAPLWQKADGDNRQPEEWDGLIERWYSTLAEFGMEDVVQRYMDLVDGKPWDIDEAERRFNTWYQEHKNDPDVDSESDEVERPIDIPESIVKNKSSALNMIETASVASPTGDYATTKDALGREALVKALAAFLDHKDYNGQNTIGLLGHWGAGKSSVLNMLEDALSERPINGFNKLKTKYLCATFNAWAYEHTDNIQAGLAQEVVNGLTKDLCFGQRFGLACRFAVKTQPLEFYAVLSVWFVIVIVLLWMGLNAEEAWQSGAAVGSGLLATWFACWKQTKTVFAHPLAGKLQTYLRLPKFGQHIGQIPIIQQQVRALCELVLTPDGRGDGKMIMTNDKRLLFMIDDLDRCGEKGIVKTLEAVKLVMDLPNVTTIIAVDHRMALAALSVHYHNLAEKGSERTAHAIARDYLGKILTLPIQLDTPGDDEIGEYLDKVLFVNVSDEPALRNSQSAEASVESNVGGSDGEVTGNDVEGGDDNKPSETSANVVHDSVKSDVTPGKTTEESDEPNKNQIMVDEVVKDSKEERDQFAALSRALRITNPRQLKRLHNSYRLLKALSYHQKAEIGSDERERLMAMLFWLEHISCLDKDARENEESYMRIAIPDNSITEKLIFATDQYVLLKKNLVSGLDEMFEDSREAYDGLKERVKVFMLPFSDISDNIEDNAK
ncbi:MAG: KAP family NTPase [Gammaproteobacteria bacterium]|nr:KAP family NTPase [Gammaproteobacteria bacterium]